MAYILTIYRIRSKLIKKTRKKNKDLKIRVKRLFIYHLCIVLKDKIRTRKKAKHS